MSGFREEKKKEKKNTWLLAVPLSEGVLLLTVHVHEDADICASHCVEHLTGHRLRKEGVIRRGDKHALPGPLQQHATFSPPDRGAHNAIQEVLKHRKLQSWMFVAEQDW